MESLLHWEKTWRTDFCSDMRIKIQISFFSLLSSLSTSFSFKMQLQAKRSWNKYSVVVTGESLSHNSFSSSAKVIHSFAHTRRGEVEQKTKYRMFAKVINSYIIHAQTNGLRSWWDSPGIWFCFKVLGKNICYNCSSS